MICAAAALPAALVLGGAARARSGAPGILPTRACRGQVAAAEAGKLPVIQTAEDFSCLDEVVTKYQTLAAPVTQDFVPADPGCSTDAAGHPNATRIIVTAYNNAGNLDFDGDFKRKDGFVVAKIENKTNCATRGIRLAANHTYYWVVEHRGRDARLVSANDQIQLPKFTSCKSEGYGDGAQQETHEHVAMIKARNENPAAGQCDHKHKPGRTHFSRDGGRSNDLFHTVSFNRAQQLDEGFVLWMTCAADCCYAGF